MIRPWTGLVLLLVVSLALAKDLYGMFDMKRTSFNKDLLQKKFKKILLKYHPDKNKSPDAQQKLLEYREAFEILDDDQRRAIYDAHGFEAAQQQGQAGGQPGGGGFGGFGGGGGGFEDLFERMFGGGGRRGTPQRPRTADSKVELHVQLEDAYQGKTHRISLTRTVKCKRCDGLGAASPKDVQECGQCQGSGQRTFYRQFGPGMVQQVRTQCDACQGRGRTYKSKCQKCQGAKVERAAHDVDVKIDAGVLDGTTIKFPQQADEAPDHDTGDLYVVLKVDPHARFRRDGANLYTTLTITLREALLGVDRIIKHLDGRMLPIRIQGRTVQPGQVESVANEGMPIAGQAQKKPARGNLYVDFVVVLPTTLPKDLQAALQRLGAGKDEL